MKDLIKASRLNQVSSALSAFFHVSEPDEIQILRGGYSTAQMFLIRIKNKRYVLRLMGLDQVLADREIQIQCAEYASKLDITPHYHYADSVHGIIVMDYIESVPFTKEILLEHMPLLLKKLHYSGRIPKPHFELSLYLKELKQDVLRYNPSADIQAYFKDIERIQSNLFKDSVYASCHNDLNLNNIIFDGQRLYLVDFEAAGEEDPFFDLATICQQACFNEQQTRQFLQTYFGNEVTPQQWQKFQAMKQVSYYYYALHFLQLAFQQGLMQCNDLIPSLETWSQMKTKGEVNLTTPEGFLLYAFVLIQQCRDEMASLQDL